MDSCKNVKKKIYNLIVRNIDIKLRQMGYGIEHLFLFCLDCALSTVSLECSSVGGDGEAVEGVAVVLWRVAGVV